MLKTAILVCMYVLGIVTALLMATLFKKTLLRGPTPAFIMELPPYRLPRPTAALRVMWDRTRQFLTRRIDDLDILNTELAAWQAATNDDERQVRWQFTTTDARIKLHHLYPNT